MKFYVANENGDWWTMEGEECLWIVTEKKLAEVREDLDDSPDKLEDEIRVVGKHISLKDLLEKAGN